MLIFHHGIINITQFNVRATATDDPTSGPTEYLIKLRVMYVKT